MLRNKGGFTLIELVMIIVILGILAAVAIPRYVDLQTDARKATLGGLYGSIRSASAIVHARALIDGKTTDCDATTVTVEGSTVVVCYGYPKSSTGGINNAVQDYTGFSWANATPQSTFTKDGAGTPADCAVGYKDPTGLGQAPTINKVESGC